ncbi:MAG: histidinol-phosphate transaminase [Anaerolineae bacterium]
MIQLPSVRSDIAGMEAYTPILPYDVLSEQLGLPEDALIKLDANENPYGAPPAVCRALADLRHVHIYPDPESRHLRRTLAAFHGLPAENILAGAGADELIDLILRLFLAPGDRVLNCPPTFGMYAFDTRVNGGVVVDVPRQPDFSLDLDAICRAVDEAQPKLLFLATPNNPDGSLLDDDTLARLLSLPLYVVLDEAYIEFAPPGSSRIGLVVQHTNLIVLRTFSKWAGLAGLRVGYGVFPAHLMPHLWKIKQPYNVSTAAGAAALAALEHADELAAIAARIVAERERLSLGLQAIPWLQPYPSQANFVLCRVVGREAVAVKAALARRGVLIRYFDKPGLRDHIRISVGRPEHTDALLAALQEI